MRRQRHENETTEFSDDEDREAFTSAARNEAARQLSTYKISRVKRNHPDEKYLSLANEDFSNLAWQKLGFYIARNDQLECLSLRRCNLSDENMSTFFNGAARNKQIKVLTLYCNSFGADGMKSLMPFLQNSRNLTSLNVSGNNIETDGFWWLMQGLGNGCIEKLNLRHCGLSNMTLLEKYYLPNLQVLYLSDNSNIGADGCSSIASLLRGSGSRVQKFYLNRCNIGDDGVQIIAESLVNNTSLRYLELESNSIRRGGLTALLKLLNNVETMQATYESNHVLKWISLKGNPQGLETIKYTYYIESMLKLNQQYDGDYHRLGRAKVMQSHLRSRNRIILSCLQGVDDYFMRQFSTVTSDHVSYYLALVGTESGLSDLYRLILEIHSELLLGIRNLQYGGEGGEHLIKRVSSGN
jgi:Ran GTPase-activating protein (RanGAP) involved in mRNA processing and transport